MKLKNIIKTIASLVAVAGLGGTGKAVELHGDLNMYYDTRGFPNSTIDFYAHDLPGKINFFGFVDSFGSREKPFDFNSYGEFKLSKNLWNGIGVAVEYNRDFSANSGITRAGILFEPKLPIKDAFFGMTFYPLSSHDDKMQLVLYGEKKFNDGDMYLRGFMDLNFKSRGVVPFTEIQFGKRIKGKLYGVIEGRYNGFSKGRDKLGIGIGLEYKF